MLIDSVELNYNLSKFSSTKDKIYEVHKSNYSASQSAALLSHLLIYEWGSNFKLHLPPPVKIVLNFYLLKESPP